METLNVRADAYATTALTNNANLPKQICMIPSSNIALRIRHTDITSKYATHLRKAATRPELENRFYRLYGWTSTQVNKIDWTAHHGAISKLCFAEKKSVLKMTHQILPVFKIFHKIDPTQSITCSLCQLHPESATHLYRCPTRHAAMEVLLNDTLLNFLQAANHTSHRLAHTLLKALYCEIENSYPEFGNRHGANDPEFRGFSGTLCAPNGTTKTQTATVEPKRRAMPANTLASWNKSPSNTLEDL